MDRLVNTSDEENERNVKEQIANFQRPDFNRKPAAKGDNEKGKQAPQVEERKIEAECRQKVEAFVTLTYCSDVIHRREDKADEGPACEKKDSHAPLAS